MIPRTLHLGIAIVLTTGLAIGVVPALAEHEEPGGHAMHPVHTIVLDGNDVRPSTTNMDHGDVIAFENYSSHPVRVTFTEPADLKTKIRCGLVSEKESKKHPADWALFAWSGDKLVATIPPGRFASVCSLESGSYSLNAVRQGAGTQVPGGSGILPAKAQIVVK